MAIYEGKKMTMNVTAHTSEAAYADEVAYDNTESGLEATDVQAAIDELNSKSGEAENVSYDNTESGLEATDVQAAVDEVKAKVDTKADIDGSYEGMTVGDAYNAKHAEVADEAQSLKTSVGVLDHTPFSSATVGINSDVQTGIQNLNKLVGVKLVKNQQFNHARITTATSHGITCTNNNDGTFTLSGVADDDADFISSAFDFVVGHQVLIMGGKTNVTIGVTNHSSSATTSQKIFDVTNASNSLYISVANGTDLSTAVTIKPLLVDLTLRYGSNDVVNAIIGNDSSKYVANLIAFDPNILKDTDYDTGSFSSCQSDELVTVDYNQWDEEWRNGLLAETGAIVEGTRVCPRNLIPVIGGRTISFAFGNSLGMVGRYALFDSNRNLILYNGSSANTINLPINCAYITFCTNADYGSTYKNDISVFYYWDGSRIGYEPYKSHSYPMPDVDLNGILKVVDGKVVADGDELTPDGSGNATNYDMYTFTGDEVYTQLGDNPIYAFGITAKGVSGNDVVGDIRSTKLDARTVNNLIVNGATVSGIAVAISGTVYISKAVYDNRASLTGSKIIYKKATPTTLTADTFTSTFYGDDFGTIWFKKNGAVIDGLQGNEIFYKANVGGWAESGYIYTNGDVTNIALKSDVTTEATTRASQDMILQNAVGGTLRQCLCVKETLSFDETDYVDLGTLTWTRHSGTGIFFAEISNKVGGNQKIMCSKYDYESVADWADLSDKHITANTSPLSKNIYINDTTYNDATTFKAAMKGILIAYEKVSS